MLSIYNRDAFTITRAGARDKYGEPTDSETITGIGRLLTIRTKTLRDEAGNARDCDCKLLTATPLQVGDLVTITNDAPQPRLVVAVEPVYVFNTLVSYFGYLV